MPLMVARVEQSDPMLIVAISACCIVALYYVCTTPAVAIFAFALVYWAFVVMVIWLLYLMACYCVCAVATDRNYRRLSRLCSLLPGMRELLLGVSWAPIVLALGAFDTMLRLLPIDSAVKRLGLMFDFPDTTNSRLLLWGIAGASVQCLQMAAASLLLPAGAPQPATWHEWFQTTSTMLLPASTHPRAQPTPQRRRSNQPSTDTSRPKPRASTASGKAANKAKPTPARPTRGPNPAASTSAHAAATAAVAPGPSPSSPSRKSSKKTRTATPAPRNGTHFGASGQPTADVAAASSAPFPACVTPGPPPAAPDLPPADRPCPSTAAAAPPGGPPPPSPRRPPPQLHTPEPPEHSSWLARISARLWKRRPAPSPPATGCPPAAEETNVDAESSSTEHDPNAIGAAPGCSPAAAEPQAGPPTEATEPDFGAPAEATEPDSGGCVVCFAARADAGFLHGASLHQCVCRACTASFQIGQECPLCRMPIERIVDVFACSG